MCGALLGERQPLRVPLDQQAEVCAEVRSECARVKNLRKTNAQTDTGTQTSRTDTGVWVCVDVCVCVARCTDDHGHGLTCGSVLRTVVAEDNTAAGERRSKRRRSDTLAARRGADLHPKDIGHTVSHSRMQTNVPSGGRKRANRRPTYEETYENKYPKRRAQE